MLSTECEQALLQLDAFRRGELPDGDVLTLRTHLDSCRRCCSHNAHEIAFLDRLLVASRNITSPDELRSTIYQLLAKESRDN